MMSSSGEISSQSTELKFAVYGQHGINKRGELVSLSMSEQKGFLSTLGTSVLSHFGQINRSQDAIDAYNARMKSVKHIVVHPNNNNNNKKNIYKQRNNK